MATNSKESLRKEFFKILHAAFEAGRASERRRQSRDCSPFRQATVRAQRARPGFVMETVRRYLVDGPLGASAIVEKAGQDGVALKGPSVRMALQALADKGEARRVAYAEWVACKAPVAKEDR